MAIILTSSQAEYVWIVTTGDASDEWGVRDVFETVWRTEEGAKRHVEQVAREKGRLLQNWQNFSNLVGYWWTEDTSDTRWEVRGELVNN